MNILPAEKLRLINSRLKKFDLKKCKFCNEIKLLTGFRKVGTTRLEEFCFECKSENKKHRRNYFKEYYYENKDRKQEYYKQWKLSGGQEIRRMHDQAREARKRNLVSDFTVEQWFTCLDYFEHSCAYCGLHADEHVSIYNHKLHQDHIIPITHNGAYTKTNIVPACCRCNVSKNNMSLLEFFEHNQNFNLERYLNLIEYIYRISPVKAV